MKIYPSYPVNFVSQFLKNLKPSILVTRYQLFKLLILFSISGFLISLTIFANELFLFKVSNIYFEYTLSFWSSNLLLLLIIFILFSVLFSNAFRGQFKMHVQFNYPPLVIDPEIDRIFKKINQGFLIVIFFYAIIFGIPTMQLSNTKYVSIIFTSALILGPNILQFIFEKFTGKKQNIDKHRLGTLHFENISYNSASIGNVSIEVNEEINRFRKIYEPNPFNENTMKYMLGDYRNFAGYKSMYEELGKVLYKTEQTNFNVVKSIVSHERTTDGVESTIRLIKAEKQRILGITTDSEYPSILEIFHNEFDSGNLKICKIDEKQLNGSYSDEFLISELRNYVNENIGNYELIIILFSHVYYKSGHVINAKKILQELSIRNREKIAFIVDGAQAVGNIQVSKEVIDNCHFYAFCGHKWLHSLPNIGFVINNEKLIQSCQLPYNEFLKTKRAFSQYDYDINDFKGTINLYPFISLYLSLVDFNKIGIDKIEKHNKFLSNYFKEFVRNNIPSLTLLNLNDSCGLVTVSSKEAKELNNFLLNRYNNSSGFLIDAKMDFIRFTFHYYMDIKHVNRLLYAILDFESEKHKLTI